MKAARCLVGMLCLGLGLLFTSPLEAQNGSFNPLSKGQEAGLYAGMVAAAAIIVGVVYLVVHKPSITGCTENGENGLAIQTEGKNRTYSLTGDTGQLRAGERVRVSGKANEKNHTFAVKKLSKDFGACGNTTAMR